MANPFQSQHIVVLPVSGAKVRVRRPSLMTMVTVSGLPTELTGIALKIANAQRVLAQGDDVATMKANFETIEAYVPYVLVDLKVADVTDVKEDADGCWVGTINLSDMADIDKQYIFMYGRHLVGPNEPDKKEDIEEVKEATTEAVSKFRGGAVGDDTGSTGEEVQPAPIESSGHVSREPVVA